MQTRGALGGASVLYQVSRNQGGGLYITRGVTALCEAQLFEGVVVVLLWNLDMTTGNCKEDE
jgi:hypothetical protein